MTRPPEPQLRRAGARFGTPLYLYDFDALERQAARLRKAIPPRFEIAYAVKANPALAVLSFLFERGFGADVASADASWFEPTGTYTDFEIWATK